MDTSETYMKMRITAIPDLGMGDGSFALKSPYFVTDNVWVAPNGDFYCKTDDVIGCQLERQDQLQEMIKGSFLSHGLIDIGFMWKWDGDIWHMAWKSSWENDMWEVYATTFEQLWLAFVMKERYNKVWSAEKGKWIEEG